MTGKKNDAGEKAVAELLQHPVGRRWLLKAGLSAAMISAVPAWAAATTGPTDPLLAGVCRGRTTACQRRLMQFALGASAKLKDLRVVVNGDEFELTRHTVATRHELKSRGTLWRKLDRRVLTHYAAVPVPRERPLLLSVHGTRKGKTVVVAQAFHVPEQATKALARAARKLQGHYGLVAGSPERLASLGLSVPQLTSAQEVADLTRIVDPHSTAMTFVLCHPNVATKDPTALATTHSLLGQTQEVGAFGSYIDTMQQNGEDFATIDPVLDASGKPIQLTVEGITTNLSTFKINQTDAGFTTSARSALIAGVQGVRNTASLGAVLDEPLADTPGDTATWHQREGFIVTPTAYVSGVGADVEAHIENPGALFGTTVAVSGAVSGRSVPLKISNDYVRWAWVYVQYLAADGTNLSMSDSASWPDTPYAQSVGLLPQVPTTLGIPWIGENAIDITLDFPAGATSARLLLCGLAAKPQSDWRQYFPAAAYPDGIVPQEECKAASIMTGIFTLGLTSFALLTDFAVGLAWDQMRQAISTASVQVVSAAVINLANALSGAEAMATVMVAGAATHAEVDGNGQDLDHINYWGIISAIASVIPRVLFSPSVGGPIAIAIVKSMVEQKALQSVLSSAFGIGEILAAVMLLGDAATLAEAIAETVISPPVIKNQINLIYTATVTISRDPRAATWPETARSWRLDATIDGMPSAVVSVTGSINDGGRTQSDPLVITRTVPFGGKILRWSFVVLDPAGNQVGSGGAQFANDGDTPPDTVAFQITELPATITAATVFRRADTTSYSLEAGGYTWSDSVVDTGTIANTGLQEVTGVAIATRLGVAGVVWKQNDKYYLRAVPVVENGNTIALGTATRQGYPRRPFLLFDTFVDDRDTDNHVLLEPDDERQGYHIRRLGFRFDPTTGAVNMVWDPNQSFGYFHLPVSAAAIHSSGHIVAVHTESCRIAQALPTEASPPSLASYSAGPGTEIGLLNSPIAVAITNPGTVLVLEAGASQLAAFDLNGNPVRYFGDGPKRAFKLPLPQSQIYLDAAVDGSGQIYVLSYANTGSQPQPADYRIDVYTPSGAPLVTHSPGTNVPRLAVDYWRSIYAANYTPVLDTATGDPRVDPTVGVEEPSFSRFDPT